MSLREAVELLAVAAAMDRSVSIEIEECCESLCSSHNSYEWLNSIMDEGNKYPCLGSQKPKIQTVQPLLREVETNKKSYDPKVVSIGPCHHGKPELQTIERLKMPMVRQFVEKWEVKIDELYDEVVKVASDARNCYAEGLTEKFNDEKFTCMMFLDGCVTLHYICSIVEGNHEELKNIRQLALVRRDLLLLENQLPFLVLRVLMRASFGISRGEDMITAFIKRITEPENCNQQHPLGSKSHPQVQRQEDKDDNERVHLLQLVRRQFIDPKAFEIGWIIKSRWSSRRSAKDFKTVGIHLKPSKTYRFTDVDFNSTRIFAILTLPRIVIDETTIVRIVILTMNLAAFEACPDYANDLGVTSYICFMDTIIDQDEDVKVLRSKGILMNYLGSDKHVADLFNEITTELAPNSDAYLQVKRRIENHHQNCMKTWIAEHSAHFRSPWTRIALAAAILAITLTVAQTVLAAYQTYLSAYPPKA